MASGYVLRNNGQAGEQRESDLSFVGGCPRIPASAEPPACGLCGAPMTFFFQVAFPRDHVWSGLTVAVFACTACADESLLIPEMLPGQLHGADIPEGFLVAYQRNFRFLVFPTEEGRLRQDIPARLVFRPWTLEPAAGMRGTMASKAGGDPDWLLDDESPRSYAKSVVMVFLMQLEEGLTFEKLPAAPPQIILGLTGEPEPSPDPYYQLFLGNALYLFGTKRGEGVEPLVYALTQV
ncbi:hypothetical protein [Paenibacillus sp. 1P07SE]|uniref:hypothetical protein n=1 Tax=Paenibacillus sp. 1P07SE TaxID=3132209 RepID=UPI0039A619DF